MPPVGFVPTISAGERPKTYALDRAATGTGGFYITGNIFVTGHQHEPAKKNGVYFTAKIPGKILKGK